MRFFLKLDEGGAEGWAAAEIKEEEKKLTPQFLADNYLIPAFNEAKRQMEKASIRRGLRRGSAR